MLPNQFAAMAAAQAAQNQQQQPQNPQQQLFQQPVLYQNQLFQRPVQQPIFQLQTTKPPASAAQQPFLLQQQQLAGPANQHPSANHQLAHQPAQPTSVAAAAGPANPDPLAAVLANQQTSTQASAPSSAAPSSATPASATPRQMHSAQQLQQLFELQRQQLQQFQQLQQMQQAQQLQQPQLQQSQMQLMQQLQLQQQQQPAFDLLQQIQRSAPNPQIQQQAAFASPLNGTNPLAALQQQQQLLQQQQQQQYLMQLQAAGQSNLLAQQARMRNPSITSIPSPAVKDPAASDQQQDSSQNQQPPSEPASTPSNVNNMQQPAQQDVSQSGSAAEIKAEPGADSKTEQVSQTTSVSQSDSQSTQQLQQELQQRLYQQQLDLQKERLKQQQQQQLQQMQQQQYLKLGQQIPLHLQQAYQQKFQLQQQQQQQQRQQQLRQQQLLLQQQQAMQKRQMMMQPQQRGSISSASGNAVEPHRQVEQLLPLVNTYIPRIKSGETALLLPIVEKKKVKRKYQEYSSDEEEEEEEEESEEDDDDDTDVRSTTGTGASESTANLTARQRQILKISERGVVPSTGSGTGSIKPRRRRRLQATPHNYEWINLYSLDKFAATKEVLVPIRLDLEVDGFRLRDVFMWNLNEKLITPEKFAEFMCLDMNLNVQSYAGIISKRIHMQLEDYRRFYQTSDFPIPEDSRVPIKLDISSGRVQLRDRFEWDLASPLTPEEFAQSLVKDLRLGGEFVNLIAISIRSQIQRVLREGEIEATFPIEAPFRAEEEARSWSPFIQVSTERPSVIAGENDDEYMDDGGVGGSGLDRSNDRNSRRMRRELRTTTNSRRRSGYFGASELRVSIRAQLSSHNRATPSLAPEMQEAWRCAHCLTPYSGTTAVRAGPSGPDTLCDACGTYYQVDRKLPDHRHKLFEASA